MVIAKPPALHALNNWVRLGVPAPVGPRISIGTPVDADTSINRLPQIGIALGGIRLPEIAAPVASIRGDRPAGAFTPPQSCLSLPGSYDAWNGDADSWDGQLDLDPSPTPEPDLQLLYSSREESSRIALSEMMAYCCAHSPLWQRPYRL